MFQIASWPHLPKAMLKLVVSASRVREVKKKIPKQNNVITGHLGVRVGVGGIQFSSVRIALFGK